MLLLFKSFPQYWISRRVCQLSTHFLLDVLDVLFGLHNLLNSTVMLLHFAVDGCFI